MKNTQGQLNELGEQEQETLKPVILPSLEGPSPFFQSFSSLYNNETLKKIKKETEQLSYLRPEDIKYIIDIEPISIPDYQTLEEKYIDGKFSKGIVFVTTSLGVDVLLQSIQQNINGIWEARKSDVEKNGVVNEKEKKVIIPSQYIKPCIQLAEHFTQRLREEERKAKEAKIKETSSEVEQIRQIVVYSASDMQRCVLHGHDLERINVTFDAIDKQNGNKVTLSVEGKLCRNCKVHYISQYQYNQIVCNYGLLCETITVDTYIRQCRSDDYFSTLQQVSLLRQMGYNVNSQENLSSEQRRRILTYAIENDVYTKNEIISHLDWLIETHGYRKNMQQPVRKWQSDLDWLRNKNDFQRRTVKAGKIYVQMHK